MERSEVTCREVGSRIWAGGRNVYSWKYSVRGRQRCTKSVYLRTWVALDCGRGSSGLLAVEDSRSKPTTVGGYTQKVILKFCTGFSVPGRVGWEGRYEVAKLFCLYNFLAFIG